MNDSVFIALFIVLAFGIVVLSRWPTRRPGEVCRVTLDAIARSATRYRLTLDQPHTCRGSIDSTEVEVARVAVSLTTLTETPSLRFPSLEESAPERYLLRIKVSAPNPSFFQGTFTVAGVRDPLNLEQMPKPMLQRFFDFPLEASDELRLLAEGGLELRRREETRAVTALWVERGLQRCLELASLVHPRG